MLPFAGCAAAAKRRAPEAARLGEGGGKVQAYIYLNLVCLNAELPVGKL